MAEYALVNEEMVVDVIVSDADFISAHGDEVKSQRGYPGGTWVLTPSKVGIGFNYFMGEFSPPAPPEG